MVFFFSPSHLRRILERSGLRLDKVLHIDWGEMTEVSQKLFLRLRFPLRCRLMRCMLVAARREERSRPKG